MKMRTVGSGLLAACALALLPWVPTARAAADWTIHSVGSPTALSNIDQAQGELASPPAGNRWNTTNSTTYSTINFRVNNGYSYYNHFGSSVADFPNVPGSYAYDAPASNNFAMEATGYVSLDGGTYTFDVNTDDGFQFWVSTTGGTNIPATPYAAAAKWDGTRTNGDVFLTYTLAKGIYKLDLAYFQSGGEAKAELSAAPSTYTSYDPSSFHLVGASDGIPLVSYPAPEPSTLTLMGIASLGLLKRRARRF